MIVFLVEQFLLPLIEMHGTDGKKIPLSLQDCLWSEFPAEQGGYILKSEFIELAGRILVGGDSAVLKLHFLCYCFSKNVLFLLADHRQT